MGWLPEIENGIISGVRLEIEDHNILCLCLDISFDGHEQGYVVTLGEENCYIAIRSILEALDQPVWSKLQGMSCRVRREKGMITCVGHIYKDKWSKRT